MTKRPNEPSRDACWFCDRQFEAGEPRRYIYPIPSFPDLPVLSARHGATSCMKCLPRVRQAQRDQGLLGEATVARWVEKKA